MITAGYIVISRRIFDHPLLKDAEYFRAWVWLITQAAWKRRRVQIKNGRALEIVEIRRGELTCSRSYMSVAWRWSEKRVRTFLNRLKLEGMIDIQPGRLQTVITICNYDRYQTPINDAGRQRGQQKGRQRARKGPEEEELKEGKHRYTDSDIAKNPKHWPNDGFVRWYELYPKKQDRGDAESAFANAQERGLVTFEELLAATYRYSESRRDQNSKFTRKPASWLKAESYTNQPDKPQGGADIAEPTLSPQSFTDKDWKDRLRISRTTGEWSGLWGPPPGRIWLPSSGTPA